LAQSQHICISCSYIQLDLGQLEVSNEISWHGCPEKDATAVRVDVLHAKVHIYYEKYGTLVFIVRNEYSLA